LLWVKIAQKEKKIDCRACESVFELKKFSPWESSVAMPSVNTPEHTESFVVQEVAWSNRSRDMVQAVKQEPSVIRRLEGD